MSGDATEPRWFRVIALFYYVIAGLFYAQKWIAILGSAVVAGGLALTTFAPAIGLVVAFIGIAGIISWLFLHKKRTHFLNPWLDIIGALDTYEVLPNRSYRLVLNLKVCAVADGVDKYRMKFKWTGSGPINISVTKGCKAQLINHGDDVWELSEIRFPYHLEKNSCFSFGVTLSMRDDGGMAKPFLRKLVDDYYPNGLTMRVILNEGLRASSCRGTVLASTRSDVAVHPPTSLPCDQQTGEVKWLVPKPRIGFRYSIDWR